MTCHVGFTGHVQFCHPKWHKYSYSFCFTLLYFNGNNLHPYYMIFKKKKNLLLMLNLVECLSKIYEIFWWYKLSLSLFSFLFHIVFLCSSLLHILWSTGHFWANLQWTHRVRKDIFWASNSLILFIFQKTSKLNS